MLITPINFTTVFRKVIFLNSSFPENNHEISNILSNNTTPTINGITPPIFGILNTAITYAEIANILAIS